MIISRYLEKYEYIRTIKLMKECFDSGSAEDRAFFHELYGGLDSEDECTGLIRDHSILVAENEIGEILSMVHYKMLSVSHQGNSEIGEAAYILCVATRTDSRGKGLMNMLLDLTEEELLLRKIPWCFLVPVDPEIYRHRGYVYDWNFNESERELLCADDGLVIASAKLLAADTFSPPAALGSIDAREPR